MFDEMNKDELKAFALDGYGVKLDMRKSVEDLRQEVAALVDPPVEEEPKHEEPRATHIKNRENGLIFLRTPALENHLKSFFLCDKDGKPV